MPEAPLWAMADGRRPSAVSHRPSAIGRWLTSDGERPKGPITNYQWPITNCGACPLVLIRLLRLYPIIVLEDLPQCRPVFLRRRHRREIRREGLGRELIATHIAGFAGVDADAAVELEFRHVQMPVPIGDRRVEPSHEPDDLLSVQLAAGLVQVSNIGRI